MTDEELESDPEAGGPIDVGPGDFGKPVAYMRSIRNRNTRWTGLVAALFLEDRGVDKARIVLLERGQLKCATVNRHRLRKPHKLDLKRNPDMLALVAAFRNWRGELFQ